MAVNVDHVGGTKSTPGADGEIATVSLTLPDPPPHGTIRAYAMVDAYPAARTSLTLP